MREFDDRALATGIFRFIVGLAFFSLLYGVFFQFFLSPLIDGSLVSMSSGQQEIGEFQTYMAAAITFLPAIAVFMLATRLIARAAFESRGGV